MERVVDVRMHVLNEQSVELGIDQQAGARRLEGEWIAGVHGGEFRNLVEKVRESRQTVDEIQDGWRDLTSEARGQLGEYRLLARRRELEVLRALRAHLDKAVKRVEKELAEAWRTPRIDNQH